MPERTWTRTSLPVAHGEGLGVAWSTNGARLAALSPGHAISLWDAMNGTLERFLKNPGAAPVRGVAFSPDNSRIASVLANGRVQIWECDSGEPVRIVSDPSFASPVLAWSPDARSLVLLRDPNIELWESYSGSPVRRINAGHPVCVLEWAPRGDLVASAGGTLVRIWKRDLLPHRSLRLAGAQAQDRSAVAWAPGAKYLFTAGEEGGIQVWNGSTFATERVLSGHTRAVTQLAVSPDGGTLASKSLDGTIRFWDLKEWCAAGQETESAVRAPFPTLAFHPSLPVLASADPGRSAVAIRRFTVNEAIAASPGPVNVFLSYSQSDTSFRRQLAVQLAPLERKGSISCWYDEKISPGQQWDSEIRGRLEAAEVVVFLVSPDFLASDYCTQEMACALARGKRGEATLVPVLLRPSLFEDSPLSAIQGVPRRNGRLEAVSRWDNLDDALKQVAQEIEAAASGRRKK
jgi:WD40 repeat protein